MLSSAKEKRTPEDNAARERGLLFRDSLLYVHVCVLTNPVCSITVAQGPRNDRVPTLLTVGRTRVRLNHRRLHAAMHIHPMLHRSRHRF